MRPAGRGDGLKKCDVEISLIRALSQVVGQAYSSTGKTGIHRLGAEEAIMINGR